LSGHPRRVAGLPWKPGRDRRRAGRRVGRQASSQSGDSRIRLLHQATVALLALAISGCHRNAAPQGGSAQPQVVDAPGLRAQLEAKRGRPVFVNFWASWCEPCVAEFPELVRAAGEWRARGISFVSISADEASDLTPVQRTLERFGASFDSVLVATGDIDALIRQVDGEWTGALPASVLYEPSR